MFFFCSFFFFFLSLRLVWGGKRQVSGMEQIFVTATQEIGWKSSIESISMPMHISLSRLWNADSIICDQNRKYIVEGILEVSRTYIYIYIWENTHTQMHETRALCRDTERLYKNKNERICCLCVWIYRFQWLNASYLLHQIDWFHKSNFLEQIALSIKIINNSNQPTTMMTNITQIYFHILLSVCLCVFFFF